MIDVIMEFLVGMLEGVLSILPDSPFKDIPNDLGFFTDVMGWINYFVPVGTILSILTVYLGAVLIWYGVRWIMRFVQYID